LDSKALSISEKLRGFTVTMLSLGARRHPTPVRRARPHISAQARRQQGCWGDLVPEIPGISSAKATAGRRQSICGLKAVLPKKEPL